MKSVQSPWPVAMSRSMDLLQIVKEFISAEDPRPAHNALMKHYQHQVLRFIVSLDGRLSAEDCEDLTQETFARILHNRGSLKEPKAFESWLLSTARNVYRGHRRQGATKKRAANVVSFESLRRPDDQVVREHHPITPAGASDALTEVLESELQRALRCAVDELPERMQQVLKLRTRDERSYREIAVILDISINTVKAHLHTAQKRLREALKPLGDRGGPR